MIGKMVRHPNYSPVRVRYNLQI